MKNVHPADFWLIGPTNSPDNVEMYIFLLISFFFLFFSISSCSKILNNNYYNMKCVTKCMEKTHERLNEKRYFADSVRLKKCQLCHVSYVPVEYVIEQDASFMK